MYFRVDPQIFHSKTSSKLLIYLLFILRKFTITLLTDHAIDRHAFMKGDCLMLY